MREPIVTGHGMLACLLVTCLLVTCLLCAAPAVGAAQKIMSFRFVSQFEATQSGQVLGGQRPYRGWIALYADGSYKLKAQGLERGRYRFANPNAPASAIHFQSTKGRSFMGRRVGGNLQVWAARSPRGNHIWVMATQVSGPRPAGTPPGMPPVAPAGTATRDFQTIKKTLAGGKGVPPIRNGVFTKTVIYGDTSAGNYYRYDRGTGDIAHDEKGLVLRPNGTYSLRKTMGSHVMNEKGRYRIVGRIVQIVFSDGSDMKLTLEQGGKKIHWYGPGGALVTEYFFFGTAR